MFWCGLILHKRYILSSPTFSLSSLSLHDCWNAEERSLKVNKYNHQSAESITWYDDVPHCIHLNIHTTNSNKQQHTVAAFNNRSQRPQFYTSDITLIRFLLQLYNRKPPKWHYIRMPMIHTYIRYSISNYTWNNLYIFRKAYFILILIIVMLHLPIPKDKIRSPFRK